MSTETRLRAALLELADVPPPADPAGAALARARRTRRRAAAGLAAAVALATAAAIAVPTLAARRAAPPATPPAPAPAYWISAYRVGEAPGPDGAGLVRGLSFYDAARSGYQSMGAELFLTPSPDGRWVAVSRDTEFTAVGVVRLDRLAAAGAGAIRWLPRTGQPVGWSPDSRRLLTRLSDRSPQAIVIEVPSLTVRQVTLDRAGTLFDGDTQVQWGPRGEGFVAARRSPQAVTGPPDPGESTELWFFDADGRATGSRRLPRADEFRFSPDGRRLLLIGGQLRVMGPADHSHGLEGGPGRRWVYTLDSGQLTEVSAEGSEWYDDERLFEVREDGDRTVARIVDIATGAVVGERVLEDDPAVVFYDVKVARLAGPAPPGAIVL